MKKKLNDFIEKIKGEKYIHPKEKSIYSYGGLSPIKGLLKKYYQNKALI